MKLYCRIFATDFLDSHSPHGFMLNITALEHPEAQTLSEVYSNAFLIYHSWSRKHIQALCLSIQREKWQGFAGDKASKHCNPTSSILFSWLRISKSKFIVLPWYGWHHDIDWKSQVKSRHDRDSTRESNWHRHCRREDRNKEELFWNCNVAA